MAVIEINIQPIFFQPNVVFGVFISQKKKIKTKL